MTNSIAELERKNDDLRQVVIRLSTIILGNAIERRDVVAARPPVAITPAETIARLREISMRCTPLREVSMRCTQLSLDSRDSHVAQALERLGADLAAVADSTESLLRNPRPG